MIETPAVAARLGDMLRRGELVVFPTETVYGLGGNGLSSTAISRIYQAKGRPSDNPVILHVAGKEDVLPLVTDISPLAERLMDAFWPGPLTILFPRSEKVPDCATGGLPTVAIRCPDNAIALCLIRAAGVPIAAPSANISGRPSPTDVNGVLHDLQGRVAAVVDGGASRIGVESTVIECTGDRIMILRPGGVTKEMLEEFSPYVTYDPAIITGEGVPKSPGMKYRHYAPTAPMTVVVGEPEKVAAYFKVKASKAPEKTLGFFTSSDLGREISRQIVYTYGEDGNQEQMAEHLYAGLLFFDDYEVSHIYAQGTKETGLGQAIMNRLLKAAAHTIIEV